VENVIEYIEETYDYKFNRPLFTREDGYIGISDDNYMKEITGFQDIIIKSIKLKYSPLEIENIFSYRILIIDDNYIFWSSNNPQLLICNPYNYTPIPYLDYNLLYQIKNNQQIMDFIINSSNDLFPHYLASTSYDDFFLNYHLYISELLRKQLKINNEAINDEFFKSLIPLIKPRLKLQKPFTSKFITSLNKSLKDD
jgi:hypothetical protein